MGKQGVDIVSQADVSQQQPSTKAWTSGHTNELRANYVYTFIIHNWYEAVT